MMARAMKLGRTKRRLGEPKSDASSDISEFESDAEGEVSKVVTNASEQPPAVFEWVFAGTVDLLGS